MTFAGKSEKAICLLCKEPITKRSCTYGDIIRRDEYECPQCGTYSLGNNCYQIENVKVLQSLYYYMLNEKSPNTDIVVLSKNKTYVTIEEKRKVKYITDEDILRNYPSNFSQHIDKALINLSKAFPDYDSSISYKSKGALSEIKEHLPTAEKIRDLVFIEGELLVDTHPKMQKLSAFLTLMVDMGYLTNTADSSQNNYRISSKGWLRVQELQQDTNNSGRVFVAMWFGNDNNKTWNSIRRAVENCGYTAIRIDKKEHNNLIVPEILHEINHSEFVIADLTGNRNGVYYEAGYAQALGKEVIITWKKTDEPGEQPHFDLAQKNMIRWNNEKELYKDLVKRIEATVGRR